MTELSNTAVLTPPFAVGAGRRSYDPRVVGIALLLLTAGAAYLNTAVHWRQAALFLVGTVAGVALYHAAFGFTSAWRVFIADRRGAGLRAQMLMLAVTCVLFLPALAAGSFLGQPVRGAVAPLGLSVAAGAFMFGIGMQLGGGCASGTLFTAGGGNTRMLVTLAAFIGGSVLGAAHMHLWERAPDIGPTSLLAATGPAGALAISLLLFAGIAGLTIVAERRRHGRVEALRAQTAGWRRFVQGPWPLMWGALALAAVNVATLGLAGRPWGVTSALALWGSKIAAAAGIDVAAWPYWSTPSRAAELQASVFTDVTSVMNFGIILGAFAAAGLAGRFRPVWRIPARSLAAAVLGGILLGYGARVAYGCNIGAYFSGIASFSLHGWLWLLAGFAGNIVGTRLRPVFGLSVERTARGCSK
jgi:uncharacterized membrane protein YedE/YeeE